MYNTVINYFCIMIQAIYTDGACKNNPGSGGWSAVFVLDFSVIDFSQDQQILGQSSSNSIENVSKNDKSTETTKNISSKIIESLKLLLKEENYPHVEIKNWKNGDGNCEKNTEGNAEKNGSENCAKNNGENGEKNCDENTILLKIGGNEASTTNNRMEMMGVIQALHIAQKINSISNKFSANGANGYGLNADISNENKSSEKSISLFTDSTYVKNGIEQWIHKWKINNWKTAQKSPVKNQDLWIQMSNYNDSMNVKWNWVKGHSGNELNDIADGIASYMANSVK